MIKATRSKETEIVAVNDKHYVIYIFYNELR